MFPLLLAAPAAPPAVAQAQPAADDFARGRELRLAGRPAEAVPYLERAAQAHPDDADIWLNLGLARSATGALGRADEALARAAALAPDYLDVQLARARIAYFRGDLPEARRRLAPALQGAPQNPEVRELQAQLDKAAAAPPEQPWRFDAAYSYARLSKDLPQTTDITASLSRRVGQSGALGLSIEHVRQFGITDNFIEATAALGLGYVAIGGTPDADFRPRWQVRGGLAAKPHALGRGWTLQPALDLGWARYPVGDVRSIHPSLTLAHGDDLDFQARWINVIDERDRYRTGYALRADWRAAGPLRLSAGWSSAPESDVGVTVNVRAATVGAAVDLGAATTLRLGYAHEMRPVYDRDELTVGFGRRF